MKQRTRDYRRSSRVRTIAHAFDIYWHAWGQNQNVFNSSNHQIVIDHEPARWDYEDQHRNHILHWAKRAADNMRLCSCHGCKKYDNYKQTPFALREAASAGFDFEELWD